ncbi:hypothetical protein FH972_023886 [Carpinus fangiana]|uniref:Transglycosylase SLT domain-containing protein n=1 Tax=Carpinus fangiana TaxID=176857 RepID=A0A5N6KX85_9ROSI|nr:hypothetical protein FH972_023886 [Carpinus fangiana]
MRISNSIIPVLNLSLALVDPKETLPQCWKGTNFPPESAWVPFEQSFKIQHNSMLFNGDSSREISAVKASIGKYAAQTGVPAELILAVIMRESSGRVDTICGDNGLSCGIMQVQGPGSFITCKERPCSNEVIDNMVRCGTVGGCPGQTGSNLATCMSSNSGLFGATASNTGSVTDPTDYAVAQYGIRQYVQDIANIMLGAESATWIKLDQQCFS